MRLDPNLLCAEYRGEDEECVLAYFQGKTNGVFVDIGAHDGFALSNTRPLWRLGWSGYMIEADSRAFAQLSENYEGAPRVTLIHAAVCDFDGTTDFYEDKRATTFSSMDQRWISAQGAHNFVRHTVKAARIGSLGLPDRFDFLNIDTEGLDSLIIETMPPTMRPTLILAETNKADGSGRIEACLTARGYREAWRSALNVAFTL